MYTIQISVRDKIATQTDGTVIINGNSDYSIEFDFDAEWADLNNKIGIFAYNDAAAHKWAYQPVMFSGNTCAVPILRDIHCVYVGVTAGNVRVTTPAKVQCRLSISDYADTEEPPSADIWGQILAKLDELQTEIDEIKAGGVGGTPDWAQNDPDGEGYIKNRCGGYDDVQTKESELQSLNCPAGKNSAMARAGSSFFPPSAGDIVSVTVDGSTKEYTLAEETVNGKSFLWFGTQNPSSITDYDAFFASDKWVGEFRIKGSGTNLSIGILYGSRSEIAGKTIGLKQRRLLLTPVKINRRYLDMPDWAKADSKPTYTASDVGAVPTDSVTTAVNAESTNENVPTAKAVYDALQNIDIPSGTDISLGVTGATVGQTIKVKAVDADGKPTAWEAVDIAAGNTEVWELINQIEIPVGAEEATAFTIDKDLKGSSFELERAQFFVYMPKYTGESTVPSFSFISVNGYYGGKIAPMIYTDILSPSAGNARDFVYLAEKDPQTGLWHESVKYEKINGSFRVGTMGGAGSYRDLYDCAGELIGVLHPITSIGIRQTIVYAGCKYWLYGVRK